MLLFALGLAQAAPGLRFDGPQPDLGQAQLSATGWMDPRSSQMGAMGGVRLGFGQELSGELAVGAPLNGRGLLAEARIAGAVLGKYDDPRLSLFLGADLSRVDSGGAAIEGWWAEAGLVGGAPVGGDSVRLYAGLVANAGLEDEALVLWFDPGLGLSWRPRLQPRLMGLLNLEAWASTDGVAVEFGPMLSVGVLTTPFDSR